MSERLVCRACNDSYINWVEYDGDLNGDMKCEGCGHVYHGIADWSDFDKPEIKRLKIAVAKAAWIPSKDGKGYHRNDEGMRTVFDILPMLNIHPGLLKDN